MNGTLFAFYSEIAEVYPKQFTVNCGKHPPLAEAEY